jgi:peroxiredoxin Q/BCP
MLNVGDKAPEFSLLDQHGVKRTLKEFAGKKVVLYFFPKANTPG